MRRPIAPWPDFGGCPIREGDRMVLPSGDCGIVILRDTAQADTERWLIDYGHGVVSSLFEAIGQGKATVIDETGMHF